MARETKIGLLVGMGFIICFAIILSNRGGDGPSRTRLSHPSLADGSGGNASVTTAEQRVRDLGRSARADRVRPAEATGRDERTDRSLSRIAAEAVSGPLGAERSVATGDASAPHTTTRLFANSELPPVPVVGPVVAEPVSTTPPVALHEPEPIVAPPPAPQPTPTPTPPSPVLPSPKPEPAPFVMQPPAAGKPYVVSGGDSLFKIVQAAYGTRKQSVVDAVFAANRAKLPDPQTLRVGQTLTLPVIDGQSPNMAALQAPAVKREPPVVKPPPAGPRKDKGVPEKKTEATAQKTPTPEPKVKEAGGDSRKAARPTGTQKTWRWYQVKNGDRYATIAERELGDKDRWSELYALNKAVFQDPSAIRSGVRIKIPVDGKKK